MLARLSLIAACAVPALAQEDPRAPTGRLRDKAEVVEKVDPYTRGEREALDKAGYVSFGPFELADRVQSADVEKALGVPSMRWIETEHFRLGSTLGTSEVTQDGREEKRLREELARLKKRIPRAPASADKLDPWLRAHLFAQRLEGWYADFLRAFQFDDADFTKSERDPRLGSGRYLGMEMKPVVVLCEAEADYERFVRAYHIAGSNAGTHWQMRGDTMVTAVSAQGVRTIGYPSEGAFTCFVSFQVAQSLLDSFGKSWGAMPPWLANGLGFEFSRRIDPRWNVAATGTTTEFGDSSWEWEPRVQRIVANGYATAWREMATWPSWADVKPQSHMLAWSRVRWLLEHKRADRRAFLLTLSGNITDHPQDRWAQIRFDRTVAAFFAAFSDSLEDCDAEWKRDAQRGGKR